MNPQDTSQKWEVQRRFSQFVDLRQTLENLYAGGANERLLPGLPPKKMKLFTNHVGDKFIESRRQQLDEFLKKVVLMPGISEKAEVVRWLQDASLFATTRAQDAKREAKKEARRSMRAGGPVVSQAEDGAL